MATTLNLVVHQQALLEMGRAPTGPVYRKWVMIMTRIDTSAKRKLSNDMVHVRTGNLRSGQQLPIVVSVGHRIVGTAMNRASYAAAVHEGSKAHDVVPRAKKVLMGWEYGGAPVFTPTAHIPAQPGRPWLRDALREVIASTR